MTQWLSGSLVYSLLCKLFVLLKNSFKRIEDAVVKLNRHSSVYRFYNFMVDSSEKELHIKKSLFYKAVAWLGGLLKKVAAGLNRFFRIQLESSFFCKVIKDTGKGFHENPYVLSGLLLAGVFVSYTAATLLRGHAGTVNVSVMAVLLAAAAIFLLLKDKIKNVICGSLSYKLLIMIIKEVLP